MGAATDDECDTGGEQGGVVEGRISVIESPKYGQTAMMHIADAVHEKTGISARLLFAQMGQETGNGDSSVAKHDHNFGGMTYSEGSTIGTKGESRGSEGGNYVHYKNLSDFATEWAVTVQNGFKKSWIRKRCYSCSICSCNEKKQDTIPQLKVITEQVWKLKLKNMMP